MLVHRLDKLEADLQILLTMQDLFLEGDIDSRNISDGSWQHSFLNGLSQNQFTGFNGVSAGGEIHPRKMKSKPINNNKQSLQHIHNNCVSSKDSNAVSKKIQNCANETVPKPYVSLRGEGAGAHFLNNNTPRLDASSIRDINCADAPDTWCDVDNEKKLLHEHIEKEKSLRSEVEESAKQVCIKLQKVYNHGIQ